jgi:hypothetical protein
MMPFCVSSFAALIKERGFVLVFSPELRENAVAVGTCVLFLLISYGARRVKPVRADVPATIRKI